MNLNSTIMKLICRFTVGAMLLQVLSSCNMFHDNLPPCPEPPVARLTFSYKYNLLNADAFASQVHCIDVYIFDAEGRFVTEAHEDNNEVIKSGNFSLTFELLPGDYQAIVYGGMACSESSFEKLFAVNENLTIEDLQIALKSSYYFDDSDETGDVNEELDDEQHSSLKLHDHFYGASSFSVNEEGGTIEAVEIPMMRNTNTIQVTLQNISGKPIDVSDFHFTIIDDNNAFDSNNVLTTTGEISYRPFSKVNKSLGLAEDNETEINVAVAHFTVSRIVIDKVTTPMLKVENADSQPVIYLPIVNYMMLFKNEYYSDMDDQEYLDRENNWKFIFFLDDRNETWVSTRIIVNDWDVRLNDVENGL